MRLPALLWRTLRSVLALVRRRRDMPVLPPRPILDTPKVSFNRAITARRSFATASLSLPELRAVRAAAGVSFNDVVLAVVAGALCRWLAERGEQPSSSLIAGVPVATDPAGAAARLAGNRVSNMFTSLCTDLADPVERLRCISLVTAQAKLTQEALGLRMLEDWVQYTPPAAFSAFMRAYSRWNAADRHRAPFNVVVSNVPGPREPVHLGQARLTDLYSVGPILEGIGLNITVWSYLDRLNFAALACPDTLPDLPGLVRHLQPALAELTTRTGSGA
jgi:diacylglycerol O-acyltransferase